MLERLSKTHRNLALLAIGVVLTWFAWTVRSVLNPLILGYLLAYILRPLVQRLQDRGMGRRPAVNVIFIVFGLIFLVGGGAVVWQGKQFIENQLNAKEGDDLFTRAEKNINVLLGQAAELADRTFSGGEDESEDDPKVESAEGEDAGDRSPDAAQTGDAGTPTSAGALGASEAPGESSTTEEGAAGVAPTEGAAAQERSAADADGAVHQVESDDLAVNTSEEGSSEPPKAELTLRHLIRGWTSSATDGAVGDGSNVDRAQLILRYLQRIFGSVMSVLAFLTLLPVYTYFLLFELERIHDFVRLHVPKRERDRVTRIGRRVGAVIANFFRGRLLICLLKGLVLAIGLTILQVPYGLLLGVLSGFLSLVPFVGPFFGFALTFLIALQQPDPVLSGVWLSLAFIGGLFILAEVLEGYVFIPKILGDSLGLHPVVILLSVFVGGAALGLFGFLIAIPLAATLIILFRELVMPAIEDFAEEDSHVDPPTLAVATEGALAGPAAPASELAPPGDRPSAE